MKKIFLGTAAYAIPTMILGYTWHFNFFPEIYARLGIYNREPPIVPLGFASMLVQGLIIGYVYSRFQRKGAPILQGVRFSLTMGLFLFSVSTLANAAKIQITDLSTWFLIQFAFHLIQFTVVGLLLGFVYRKVDANGL